VDLGVEGLNQKVGQTQNGALTTMQFGDMI
jgi:hypothetical protein